MFFTVSSSLPAPRLAADAPRLSFMLAFKLSKNSCKLPSFSSPSSVRLRVQKYYIFLYLQQLFSLFFKLFPFALNVSEIRFDFFRQAWRFRLKSGRKRPFPPRFQGSSAGGNGGFLLHFDEIRAHFTAFTTSSAAEKDARLRPASCYTLLYKELIMASIHP